MALLHHCKLEDSDEKKANVTATVHPTDSNEELEEPPKFVVRPTIWPQDPRPLVKPTSRQGPSIAYDAILILTPLVLIAKIALCIAAYKFDHGSTGAYVDIVSSLTINLIRFNAQLTTLFTLVFITILSTLVRRIALWRAQNGATVAELEQWQASISLVGTVKTIWSLRMYTISSVALVSVWVWYYLGSQASSREYLFRDAGRYWKTNITVTNPHGPSGLDLDIFPLMKNSDKSLNNAQFAMSVGHRFSSLTGHDLNGYMLIPFVSELATHKPDRHGFFTCKPASEAAFAKNVGVQSYALFKDYNNGTDIYTAQMVGNAWFNTSYLNVDCTPAQARNVADFPSGLAPTMAVSLNFTGPANSSQDSPATFDIWYRVDNPNAPIQVISSTCTITHVPIDVQAYCDAQGCVAKKLKPIPISAAESYQTPFQNSTYAENFLNQLLLSTGIPSSLDDMTIAEDQAALPHNFWDSEKQRHVSDLDLLTDMLPGNIQGAANEQNLTVTQMQQSIQTALANNAIERSKTHVTPAINTYLGIYQHNLAQLVIQNNYTQSDAALIFQGITPSPWLNPGHIDGTWWNPQYSISWAWIALDFISCTILLAASIFSAWLRPRILAPDIFGYVSSLTRDNPHVPLPQAGSTLSGFARARLLRHVKVQIAHVPVDEKTGTVCLVPVAKVGQPPVAKLSKTCQYV